MQYSAKLNKKHQAQTSSYGGLKKKTQDTQNIYTKCTKYKIHIIKAH